MTRSLPSGFILLHYVATMGEKHMTQQNENSASLGVSYTTFIHQNGKTQNVVDCVTTTIQVNMHHSVIDPHTPCTSCF